MQAFTRKNIMWLFAAIGWHALIDATAVFAVSTWGPIPTEAAVGVLAVIGLALMIALRQPEPLPAATAAGPTAPALADDRPLATAAPTAEQLDRTRYQ